MIEKQLKDELKNIIKVTVDRMTEDKIITAIKNQISYAFLNELRKYGIDDIDVVEVNVDFGSNKVASVPVFMLEKYFYNFLNQMKGIPDAVQKAFNKVIRQFNVDYEVKQELYDRLRSKGYNISLALASADMPSNVLSGEIKVKGKNYEGTVKISDIELDGFNVKKFVWDDEILKSYGVDKFVVIMPDNSRYVTNAVNEKVAIERVVNELYDMKDLQVKSRVIADIECGNIKAERLIDATRYTNVDADRKNNVCVVTQVKASDDRVQSKVDDEPKWVGYLKDDLDTSYIDDKMLESLERQISDEVQKILDDLEIPMYVVKVVVTKCSDDECEGWVELNGEDKVGRFLYQAVLKNGRIANVEPRIDSLKGMYDIKRIQVEIGDRVFQTDAKDEVTAVKKVLSYLVENGEQLVYDGKSIGKYIDSDLLEKLASSQTKIIKIYNIPGELEVGKWKIVKDKDKYYFEKEE